MGREGRSDGAWRQGGLRDARDWVGHVLPDALVGYVSFLCAPHKHMARSYRSAADFALYPSPVAELLRRTAQSTVQTMVRVVFEHLKTLEPPLPTEDVEDPVSTIDGEQAPATSIMDPTGIALADEVTPQETAEAEAQIPSQTEVVQDGQASVEVSTAPSEAAVEPSAVFAPYGSATPTELVRVLITLLNPSDPQHTDSMRLAALGILNTTLEVAGRHLGYWPEIRGMLSDEGCKFLLQLTRSDSPTLFSYSLRVASTIFETMREWLKPQMELFLSYLIDRLTPPPSALHPSHRSVSVPGSAASSIDGADEKADGPVVESVPRSRHPVGVGLAANGEYRELLLECLAQLARHPSFLVDLWINYDCDMDCEDLFEKTIGFLTRVSLSVFSRLSFFRPNFSTFIPLAGHLPIVFHGWTCAAGGPSVRLPRHPPVCCWSHGRSS